MKSFLLLLIGAYAAGSVNFSILLFRILEKGDPREEFSGNAGVTNVYRQAGYLWAAVVLVMDLARAMTIALIATILLPMELVPWIGLGLILGNRFPCFHNFRGGKGVANYLGFTTVIAPLAASIAALSWVATYAFFRIPFIGSFLMVFILAAGTLLACDAPLFGAAGILATVALVYYGHKRNVVDLLEKRKRGKETK
jgi:glycerol-3-phosphate acyltransferase PlsY